MPTLRDIRKRIRAIQSTQKITKAMKMVAAAKLRRVQDRMLNFRPYATSMHSVLSNLAMVAERELHPLLIVRPRKTVEVLVITSDRGLCGAFNANILRAAGNYIESLKKRGFELTLSVVGRKASDYFRRRNLPTRKAWVGLSGRVTYANAQEIANDLIENYINKTIDEVILIYNEFKTLLLQKVSIVRLLPIRAPETEESQSYLATGAEKVSLAVDFIYEPSAEKLFERLLPKHIEIQIYRALLESSAAEEAARMNAMENATKNCDELIAQTTLLANKIRQATITKELMDIVGGVEALK